jgi:hypothetical protein
MQTYAGCAIRTLDKGESYSWERNPSSRQRRCYIRTMTARVQLQQKISGREPQRGLVPRAIHLRENACHKLTLTRQESRRREWVRGLNSSRVGLDSSLPSNH